MYPAQSLCRLLLAQTPQPKGPLKSGHFSTISGSLRIFSHAVRAGEF
jgi:hypothetical protein